MKRQVILIVTAIIVSSLTALAQSYSATFHNAGPTEAMAILRKATGHDFVYQKSLLESNGHHVNGEYKDISLIDLLDKTIVDQLNMSYKVTGNTVTINKATEQPNTLRKITGTVVDEEGEPLPGATIRLQGSKWATASDINGYFTLDVNSKDPKLKIDYVGMKPTTVDITASTKMPLTIRLKNDDNMMDEVIVTGYTTLSKERATGAFGTLSAKDIDSKLGSNLANRLEGKMAGVVLNKDGSMSIRGISTINAETEPLIVVDGYPTECKLSDLNPDNIENITVLKDAVAASIYGSRSANGVIIVTSKQGKEGKMSISYRGTFMFQPRPDLDKLHMASASDYIDGQIAMYEYMPYYYDISYTNTQRNEVDYMLDLKKADMLSEEEFNQRIDRLRSRNALKEIEREMFRTSFTQTHNVGISGGSTANRYNLAINYTKTEGSFINTNNDRVLVDFNNQWKPFKFLTAGFAANVNYSKSKSPYLDGLSLTSFNYNIMPYSQLKDGSGNLVYTNTLSYSSQETLGGVIGGKSMGYNAIRESYLDYNTTSSFSTRLNAFLRFTIIEGLNAEIGGNWTKGSSSDKEIAESDSYRMAIAYNSATSKTNPATHYIPDGAMIDERRSTNENWTIRTQVSYAKSFGLHRISALGGNEVRRITFDNNTYATRFGYNAVAGNFTAVNLVDLKTGVNKNDMVGDLPMEASNLNYGSYSLRDNRFVSWYFNGSYEYNNKYLISGSIRDDQTNFFGTDPKFRHKPLWSIGGTWKINNESFFNVDWINRLNLRASYGVNGNISLSEGPYLILSAGNLNGVTDGLGYRIVSYPNNSLRWEKTKTTNVGLDFDFLNNRAGFSLDYYFKKTSDILAADAMDPTTGTSNMTKNAGSIENRGLELALHGTPVRSRDFSWNIFFNITFNKNKVIEYNVARPYLSSWWATAVHAEGYPMHGLFGLRFAGLNDQGSTMVYNNEGEKIAATTASLDDIVYLGSAVPKTDLSFTNTFEWRNWNLSFMFIAKLGHKYRKDVFTGENINSRYVGQRWQKPGDEEWTIYPKYTMYSRDAFYFPFCDVNVGNASYAKLRDVTLAYTFSKNLLSKIGMKEARVYFQARNLFLITGKGVDIDPETMELTYNGGMGGSNNAGYSTLPRPSEYYLGLSFSF